MEITIRYYKTNKCFSVKATDGQSLRSTITLTMLQTKIGTQMMLDAFKPVNPASFPFANKLLISCRQKIGFRQKILELKAECEDASEFEGKDSFEDDEIRFLTCAVVFPSQVPTEGFEEAVKTNGGNKQNPLDINIDISKGLNNYLSGVSAQNLQVTEQIAPAAKVKDRKSLFETPKMPKDLDARTFVPLSEPAKVKDRKALFETPKMPKDLEERPFVPFSELAKAKDRKAQIEEPKMPNDLEARTFVPFSEPAKAKDRKTQIEESKTPLVPSSHLHEANESKISDLTKAYELLCNEVAIRKDLLLSIKAPVTIKESESAYLNWEARAFFDPQTETLNQMEKDLQSGKKMKGLLNYIVGDVFQSAFKRDSWKQLFTEYNTQTGSPSQKELKKRISILSSKEIIAAFIDKIPVDIATIWLRNMLDSCDFLPFIHMKLDQSKSKGNLKHICNLDTFFFAFEGKKPIILNFGAEREKTKSLNMVFKTEFPRHDKNVLHDGSADILVDRIGRGYHIIDFHGNPLEKRHITKMLIPISGYILFHCNINDFEQSGSLKVGSEAQELIEENDDEEEEESFIAKLEEKWNTETTFPLFYDQKVEENERKFAIHKVLDPYIKKTMKAAFSVSYDDINEIMLKNKSENVDIRVFDLDLTKDAQFFRKQLNDAFDDLKKSEFLQFSRQMKKFQKPNLTSEERAEMTRLRENFKLDPITSSIFKTMFKRIDDNLLLFYFEISRILQSEKERHIGDLIEQKKKIKQGFEELNEKLLEKMKELQATPDNSPKKSDIMQQKNTLEQLVKEKKESIQQKEAEITPFEVGLEHMWREAIIYSENNLFGKKGPDNKLSSEEIQALYLACLRLSIPIEIVDGDTLEIKDHFLKRIFSKLNEVQKFSVFTVCGPQSSGKSFLLNHLYNCFFAVRDGRCSRGLYLTLKKTDQPQCPYLLILDTEGLLSPEREEKSYVQGIFDRQITAFSMALSDVLCFNLKGELSSSSKNVIDMSVWALHALRTSKKKPQFLFIMRDISTTDADQQIAIQRQCEQIITNINDNANKDNIKIEEWTEFGKDYQDNFFMVPSPFNQETKKIPGCGDKKVNTFSDVFPKELRRLEESLAKYRMIKNNNNVLEWFEYLVNFWSAARAHGKFFQLASTEQLTQEKTIATLMDDLGEKYCKEAWDWFSKQRELFAKELSNEKNLPAEIKLKFETSLHERHEQSVQKLCSEFKEKVKILNLPDHVLNTKIEIIKNKLSRDFEQMKREIQGMLLNKEIHQDLNLILQDFEKWISSTQSIISESPVEEVEAMFKKKHTEFLTDLKQKLGLSFNPNKLEEEIKTHFSTGIHLFQRVDESLFDKIGEGLQEFAESIKLINPKQDPGKYQFANNVMEHINTRSGLFSDKQELKGDSIQKEIKSLEEKISSEERNFKVRKNPKERTAFFMELMSQITRKLQLSFQRTKEKIIQQFEDRFEQIRKYALLLSNSKNDNKRVASFLAHEISDSVVNEVKKQYIEDFHYVLNEEIRKQLPKSEILKAIEISHDMSKQNKLTYFTQPSIYIRQVFELRYESITADIIQTRIEKIRRHLAESHIALSAIARQFTAFVKLIDLNKKNILTEEYENEQKEKEKLRDSLERDLFNLLMSSFSKKFGDFPILWKEFTKNYNIFNGNENILMFGSLDIAPTDHNIGNIESEILLDKNSRRIKEPITGFFHTFRQALEKFEIEKIAIKLENEMKEAKNARKGELMSQQLGCMESCPYCHAPCELVKHGPNIKHSTCKHKIMAFGHCNTIDKKEAWLDICTTPRNFQQNWLAPGSTTIGESWVFPTHLQKFHSTWEIQQSQFVDGGTKLKAIWKEIGQEVCDKYDMKYNETFYFE